MNLLRRSATAALVALVLARVDVPNAHATPIDWVTVGDPGNAADTTTYGAVGYEYQIMKFEWTNSQYVEFLNAVDPDGTNPDSIYNSSMGSNARGGITNNGTTSGSRYAFKTNMGDKPVNYVSWWDAARVANWLQAGGTNSPTSISGSAVINSGAYTLSGATSGTAPAKNVGAQYWVPTENEWYKAAYYKGSGTNAGYWQYATQVTGTAPIAVGATSVGTGTSGGVSPVISGNFANYNLGAVWNGQTGNVTTVGSNGGPSAYGAFDMSGNVREWNDLDGNAGSLRGLRGGAWDTTATNVSRSGRTETNPSNDPNFYGFRLAAVPEPSTWVMGLAGIACGGFSMWRRRKRA